MMVIVMGIVTVMVRVVMMVIVMVMVMIKMKSVCHGMIERPQVVNDRPSVENSSFLARLPIYSL